MIVNDNNKSAEKVIDILYAMAGNYKLTRKEHDAIGAVSDLLDNLQMEGRWE